MKCTKCLLNKWMLFHLILFCFVLLFNTFYNWSKVYLPCCINLCYTTKGFIYISFYIFSIIVSHRILYIFPCYTIGYFFIHSIYNSLHLQSKTPIPPFPHSTPLWQPQVFSLWVWFYFENKFIVLFLDSIYKWYNVVFAIGPFLTIQSSK